MSDIESRIREWQREGLLDPEAARRILAYERDRTPASSEAETPALALPVLNRPTVIEAVVYLGLVVIAAGFIFLVAMNWEGFETWARLAICIVPTVALVTLGFALGAVDNPGLKRGGQLALFVSVALFAVTILVGIDELGGDRGGDTRDELLLTALLVFAFAVVLWVLRPQEAQVAAIAGSALFLLQSMANWPDDFSPEMVGLLGLVFGAVALALAEFDKFGPKTAVRVCFGLFLVITTYVASFETRWWFETLAFIASAGLLALGVARNSFALVVLGITGIFLALVTFVFAHFSDDLGAPVALIISGALVLMGVMLVVQARSITRTRTRMRQGQF